MFSTTFNWMAWINVSIQKEVKRITNSLISTLVTFCTSLFVPEVWSCSIEYNIKQQHYINKQA